MSKIDNLHAHCWFGQQRIHEYLSRNDAKGRVFGGDDTGLARDTTQRREFAKGFAFAERIDDNFLTLVIVQERHRPCPAKSHRTNRFHRPG